MNASVQTAWHSSSPEAWRMDQHRHLATHLFQKSHLDMSALHSQTVVKDVAFSFINGSTVLVRSVGYHTRNSGCRPSGVLSHPRWRFEPFYRLLSSHCEHFIGAERFANQRAVCNSSHSIFTATSSCRKANQTGAQHDH